LNCPIVAIVDIPSFKGRAESTPSGHFWGGLQAYQQLAAVAIGLRALCQAEPTHGYWQQLALQVERTLEKNHSLANQLLETHDWLTKIAACLRYPPGNYLDQPVSGQQVAKEMNQLLVEFQPDRHRQRPQSVLRSRLHYLWRSYGGQLLPCYDIPGLPADNLQLETFFNRVRRHQRRISGRKSTRELNRFGHYQVLFTAESEAELLEHLRRVPFEVYQAHCQQLKKAEKPRQFLCRSHRNPGDTVRILVSNYLNPPLMLLEGSCSVKTARANIPHI
jgi:hypothetical protein